MTIMITVLTDLLEFTSMEIGISVLILLLAYIPAGFVASFMTLWFNPIRSSIMAVTVIVVVTAVAAAVLTGPGQQTKVYILVFFWGLGVGWKWTCDRMLAVAIIPPGQSAEYMGIYLFFGAILTWLPPLVFTSLNEAGVSERIGLAVQDVYLVIGLIGYVMMGDYRKAVHQANGLLRARNEVVQTIDEGSGNKPTDERNGCEME